MSNNVTICSSYTAEPLEPALRLLFDRTGVDCRLRFSPYSQVLQELLAANSTIRRDDARANVLLVRATDFMQSESVDDVRVERAANELVAAVTEYDAYSKIPLLLVVTRDKNAEANARFENILLRGLQNVATAHCISDSRIAAWYPVDYAFDDDANALGHIPYQDNYYAALATTIARFVWRLGRPDKKVLVVDCDNTLWGGVCGEVGPSGIEIGEQHLRLQKFLKDRSDAGTLLCLCSKNVLEDVQAVFEQRGDMILQGSDIVSWKVDWNAKADNTADLASELSLSPDSFIFLDDNPVEIAAMRASLPQVLSVQFPDKGADRGSILDHCWSLDNYRLTEADKLRKASYQSEGKRQKLMRSSASFESFLEGLELVVDIRAIGEDDIPRVSQMTNRTNQFNATTRRMTESEVRELIDTPDVQAYTCRVKDRFGDYGLVGCVFLTTEASRPCITDFMLSCRVLGRGVEHRIMKFVAGLVDDLPGNTGQVAVAFKESPKNMPMRDFLASICPGGLIRDEGLYAYDTDQLNNLKGPTASATSMRTRVAARPAGKASAMGEDDAMQVAWELRTPERLLSELHSQPRKRSALEMPLVKPRSGIEQKLADIWCSVLHIDAVGRTDRFVDLGGTSLDVIRVHGEILKQIQRDIPLPTLLGCPTIAELADTVDETGGTVARVGNAKDIAARQRAALRRNRAAMRTLEAGNGR